MTSLMARAWSALIGVTAGLFEEIAEHIQGIKAQPFAIQLLTLLRP